MQSLKTLLHCIRHLGLTNGYHYWQINKYYSNHPKEYAEFLFEAKKRAILIKDKALIDWFDLCQKTLDEWNKKRKLKS